MRTRRRRFFTAGTAAFAPPAAADHPLKIVEFRAWRIKEPVSNRRYTVICLKSQGGTSGYGEGGPALAAEIVTARIAAMDRRATESEFIRAELRHLPALEAAVNNAMLDLVSRAHNVPIYQYLGGPVRFKARILAYLEGKTVGVPGLHHDRAATGCDDPASRLRRSGAKARDRYEGGGRFGLRVGGRR